MAFDWTKVITISTLALANAPQIMQAAGQSDHIKAAQDSLDNAAAVASQVITDPQELAEAQASYSIAKGIIGLVALFVHKK